MLQYKDVHELTTAHITYFLQYSAAICNMQLIFMKCRDCALLQSCHLTLLLVTINFFGIQTSDWVVYDLVEDKIDFSRKHH